ncbi:poly polymerase catalytic domain-containing protein [Xylaria nigripes]|nr:poly polymerase catalytic domain-containing protein [Xylaria nigripes]
MAMTVPALPFYGLKIAISGSIPGRTQSAIERHIIHPLGGVLVKYVSSATTHLVASEAVYQKPSPRVKSAQALSIPIVTIQWLDDCFAQNAHLKESAYSHVSQSSALVDGSTLSSGPRKRIASQDNDDNNAPPQAKQSKAGSSKSEEPKPKDAASHDGDVDHQSPQSKKRRKTKNSQSEEPMSKVTDYQVAKSRDVKIPLDQGVEHWYEVYIDDDGVIYDASLNQTNSTSNNNKFYRIQVLHFHGAYCTWTRWGRVGEYGQSKMLSKGPLRDALKQFNDKFKSKSGLAWVDRGEHPKTGKYAFIEKSYESDSEDEDAAVEVKAEINEEPQQELESKLPRPIQELMQLIFNTEYFANAMTDLKYDATKLPLGKLSKTTITRGFQALKDLSALLDDLSLAQSLYGTDFGEANENLSNLFFTIIPHAFGRRRPPVIRSQAMVKQELTLLESLSDMKDAAQLMKSDLKTDMNSLDRMFQGLGMNEMTPLSHTSEEFAQLSDYLMRTHGTTHSFKFNLQEIFRIERNGEFARFDASHQTPRNRRLLWHGSRCTNFGGILSQGLRIAPPEAPVSGYMFGKGIYLADMSSKSANYCCSYISGGQALLLLCEAELGDPMQVLKDADSEAGEKAAKSGMLSTMGLGNFGPSQWKDAGCVHPSLRGVKMPDVSVEPGATNIDNLRLLYHEYICYDVSQVRLRYLFRLKCE